MIEITVKGNYIYIGAGNKDEIMIRCDSDEIAQQMALKIAKEYFGVE